MRPRVTLAAACIRGPERPPLWIRLRCHLVLLRRRVVNDGVDQLLVDHRLDHQTPRPSWPCAAIGRGELQAAASLW